MKTFIVDSFTDKPFAGNPAGVCLTDSELPEPVMQSIAKELNFSETTFVVEQDVSNEYSIRYFSPAMEIPLCGHATLAASKVLFEQSPTLGEIRFFTGQGLELIITKSDERIVMEFPVYGVKPATVPVELLEAVGVSDIVNCVYNQETDIILIEIDSTDLLGELKPDYPRMVASFEGIHGLLVTARSNSDNHVNDEYDFHSRFFWPWSGGTEDPVTGGTHTFLAKYWSDRLGKTKLRSFQSSQRTGSMDVELLDNDKLLIKANAVILLEGEWVGELPKSTSH